MSRLNAPSRLYASLFPSTNATLPLLLLLGSTALSAAQSVNATLRGTVMDATGSVVANAQVEIYEPLTGQKVRETTSTTAGDFEISELKPGTYELRCGSSGFKQFVAQNIVLDSGQIRRINPTLALGSAAEEVTVSAGAAVISTESASISGLFTAKQHDESPQVTIYPTTYALLTTLSGVQGGKGSPIANGQTQQQQSQTFDGIANDLQGNQSNNAYFFEQVSASLFNAPAESAVPVQINLVTKRGSNAFHGRASYRIYDSVFNAKGYFDTRKSPYLQHEWDLEGGSYIWRDRTFFYGQWFAQKIPLGYQTRASVPTAAWRSGIFSGTIVDPLTGLPFPNNTIPAARISPVSKAFQDNYLPAPNVGAAGSSVNNYAFQFPFNSDLYRGDWPLARIDHQVTKSNSFFARWLMRQTPYVLNNGLPALVWTRNRRNQQWAAGDTHVFTPQAVNEFRFGYSTDYTIDGQTNAGVTPSDGALVLGATGLQGSNPSNSKGQGFPSISITGLTALTNVAGGVKANNHITTFVDNFTWQKGRHVLKFGGSAVHFSNYYGFVNDYGTFTFDGSISKSAAATSESAYADFLLGLPRQSQRTNPLGAREQTLNEYGFFAQDSFKMTPKLNVDYGVRWDVYGTPTAADHLMYNFDPATGSVIVDPAAITKVSPLYPKNINVQPGDVRALVDKTNVVPRLGAAYQLTGNSVVRGGYGIYISRFGSAGAFNNFLPINPQLGSTGPFSISEIYNNAANGSTFSFPNPYPSAAAAVAPSQSIVGYPRQVNHGHIHQFSATYEIELKKIGFRASYVGSRSTGQNYTVNIDKPTPGTSAFASSRNPYPQFVAATVLRFDGGANYNGLQFDVRRRVGALTFSANYALSSSKANYLNTENPYNLLNQYANDGLTRRHYSSGTVTYALPFGRGRRFLNGAGALTDRTVGGWSTVVLTYLGSGTYFSPAFSGADPSNTNTLGGLPDLVGDPNNVPGGRSKTNWFNTAAFAVPQQGRFGNALPNSLVGQSLYQTHVSLIKTTTLTERVKFNFVTQISNLFNHAQFLNPSGNISSASGNQFTGQIGTFDAYEGAKPRNITFEGAFVF
ncbi:MAG: carboxypeptidase regulatory-like domain-containing protein [Janthinobacterium lividum]